MGACATAAGAVSASLENFAFQAENLLSSALSCDNLGRARHIQQLLKRVGLTISRASALTRMRFGAGTPYYIPPTFLYKVRNGITPHVCQLVALSEVTGCSFSDWMNLCGFDLGLIAPLQLEVHSERTALITPVNSLHGIPFRPESSKNERSDRYLFVKIGSEDNVTYPKLLAGSVMRADRCYSPQATNSKNANELLWLVEHPGGLACCHVKRIDDEHIVLLPSRFPLSAWPLRLSQEAWILGLIDLELFPGNAQQIEPSYLPLKTNMQATIPRDSNVINLATLLRSSRARAGLTLRAAHQKTVRIAQLLRNPDYRIPLGLLSDYEASDCFPRHIAKIISLCVVYGIDFWQMMRAGGSQIDDTGKERLFSSERLLNQFAFAPYRKNVRLG